MIDKAIEFLKDEINAHLKLNVGEDYGNTAKSASLLNQDGSVEAILEIVSAVVPLTSASRCIRA